MELVRALEQSWSGIRNELSGLAAEDWSKPTPCSEWDVHDLAAHCGGIEAYFQGLHQPDPPAGWTNPHTGLDAATAAGVAARSHWSADEVLSEIDEASTTQLDRLRALDEQGWKADAMGPIGPTTVRGLAEVRAYDLFVHLMDLRFALGGGLSADDEVDAAEAGVRWAVDRIGWSAVKQSRLPDGSRVRLELTGPGARTCDVVVSGTRGACATPSAESVSERIEGSAVAFLLLVTGRQAPAESIGLPVAHGPLAERLLDGYRMFA